MHSPTRSESALVARLPLSAGYFANAAFYSRQWDSLVASALAEHGDHGAQISGIGRDHFPEDLKNRLRTLARLVTEENEKGRNARPRRVRSETMHRLARIVCRRDGGGFYGYRAA